MIRVLLADDQALVRAGFRALLDAEADITVVAEAGDGPAAVRAAGTSRPDVVLMDIRMPGVDGLEATRRIAADPALSATRIVILTTFDLDEYVFEALRRGRVRLPGQGHRAGRADPRRARGGRRRRAALPRRHPPADRRSSPSRDHRALPPLPPPDQLTDREREVVALVGAGLSNDEIAARLVVSPATAKTHVSRAMIKLAARDRAQLVVYAYEAGLVRPSWTDVGLARPR